MDDKLKPGRRKVSDAKLTKLRSAGIHMEAFSEDLQRQVSQLDEKELAVLVSIKRKLNDGLAEDLRVAADTVGGFVW